MTVHQSKQSRPGKPSKPYRSFPLTAYNNGQWCKKIRGKIYFFRAWCDPQAAMDNYRRAGVDLQAGRQPQKFSLTAQGMTVKKVANRFLTYQLERIDFGEIPARWFEDCLRTIEHFTRFVSPGGIVFNIRPDDFHKYRQRLITRGLRDKKGLGAHALERSVTVIKAMFRHA